MRILITGGTGLIGSALSEQLQANDHQVVIVSRQPGKQDQSPSVIPWKTDQLRNEIEAADAVIHLAGASIAGAGFLPQRWTSKRKAMILASRVETGKILTQAIQNAARKPAVLIQASAIGYYGNVGETAADESSPAGEDFLAEVCLAWEGSTQEIEIEGVRRVVARIGLVLSKKGGLYPLLSLPYRLFLGGRIGDGKQVLSWIHINDLVKSIVHLLEDPSAQGIYNLTAPAPVSNQVFGKSLGTALNRPQWLTIPGFVIKILLGEAATLALDGRAVFPGRLLKSGYSFEFPDLASAQFDLK